MGGINDIRQACAAAGFKAKSVTMQYDNERGEQVFTFERDGDPVVVRCCQGFTAEQIVELAAAQALQADAPRNDKEKMPQLGPTLLRPATLLSPDAAWAKDVKFADERPEVPRERTPFSSQASDTSTDKET